jgi:DNA-binding CsgD family transcriptional regulator
MYGEREGERVRLRKAEAALDHAGIATLVVDDSCDLVFANAAAEAMLTAGDALRRMRGQIGTGCLTETFKLQAAISHVIDGEADSVVVLSVQRAGGRPLTAAISALRCDDGAPTMAMLQVVDPEQPLDEMIAAVCTHNGLTPVETRLVCLLVEGRCVVEAAKRMRVQEQTARGYLKQIFSKTGTNRQAELVSVMLRNCVRLPPGTRLKTA